jgi:hypothetical protein
MTEKELESLGFTKEVSDGVMCEGDDGTSWVEDEFYYYSLDLVIGFGFISCASTDVGEDGQWYVDFFDSHPQIRFTDYDEFHNFISLVETRIVK